MSENDIETRFELYLDSLDMSGVRYHYVSKGVLEQGEKKMTREARYDTEESTIELRGTYYLDGEVIEKGEWSPYANVDDEGSVSDPDVIRKGDDLKEAMAKYLKSEFFSDPEAELGEIYYEATGVK